MQRELGTSLVDDGRVLLRVALISGGALGVGSAAPVRAEGTTMNRVALGAMLSAMAAVLVACPAPPAGYQPPRIESVEVTPRPARAGEDVTLVIEVSDDHRVVSAGAVQLFTPNGTTLNAIGVCDTDLAQLGGPAHVELTVTCPVPEVANNGTWQLELRINDGEPLDRLPGLTTRLAFEVAGGSDDVEPPRLLSYDIQPDTVDQDTPFTLTARLSDETPPFTLRTTGLYPLAFTKPFAINSTFQCHDRTFTPVSATEVDLVAECRPYNYDVAGRSEVGLHRAFMTVRDALGNERQFQMEVDVRAAPAD